VSKLSAETQKVVISIPSDTYLTLMQMSRDEIRTIPGQARYLMELGMQVSNEKKMMEALGMMGDGDLVLEDDDDGGELQPAIGFKVDTDDGDLILEMEEDDDEDEEDIAPAKPAKRGRPAKKSAKK
jgi:hypothetical protein